MVTGQVKAIKHLKIDVFCFSVGGKLLNQKYQPKGFIPFVLGHNFGFFVLSEG